MTDPYCYLCMTPAGARGCFRAVSTVYDDPPSPGVYPACLTVTPTADVGLLEAEEPR